MAAVRQWTFEPAEYRGKPESAQVICVVGFGDRRSSLIECVAPSKSRSSSSPTAASYGRVARPLNPASGVDALAVEVAKAWIFDPATRNSQAVASLVTLEFSFTSR